MKNVDRALLIALVMGVWALVLKPEAPTAHSGQHCDIDSANGYGEIEELMEGGSVYVYQITGTAYCYLGLNAKIHITQLQRIGM